MNTEVITKTEINRILRDILDQEHLVYEWWHSANLAFDNRTPEQVYQSGSNGRATVRDYVMSHSQQ